METEQIIACILGIILQEYELGRDDADEIDIPSQRLTASCGIQHDQLGRVLSKLEQVGIIKGFRFLGENQ